ncbi:hypothetical protein T12_15199, partial [Trichinella patagoniensis]
MKKNSENAVDTKQNADGTEQKNKREKFDAVRGWKHCVLIRKLTAANSALVRLTYVANGSVVKRSLTLRYANNDRHKRCLIVSKIALVRLTYVANMNNEEKKKRKQWPLVEQIADGMKQNKKRQK